MSVYAMPETVICVLKEQNCAFHMLLASEALKCHQDLAVIFVIFFFQSGNLLTVPGSEDSKLAERLHENEEMVRFLLSLHEL